MREGRIPHDRSREPRESLRLPRRLYNATRQPTEVSDLDPLPLGLNGCENPGKFGS